MCRVNKLNNQYQRDDNYNRKQDFFFDNQQTNAFHYSKEFQYKQVMC
jgi:hypothetical protein